MEPGCASFCSLLTQSYTVIGSLGHSGSYPRGQCLLHAWGLMKLTVWMYIWVSDKAWICLGGERVISKGISGFLLCELFRLVLLWLHLLVWVLCLPCKAILLYSGFTYFTISSSIHACICGLYAKIWPEPFSIPSLAFRGMCVTSKIVINGCVYVHVTKNV